MLDKYHCEQPITNFQEFEQGLVMLCNAKNAMSRHEGYTPELLVLGKVKPIPGSNISESPDSAWFSHDDISTEGSRFRESLARREAARIAFVRADHSAVLRKALNSRSRPTRQKVVTGDLVMYWKAGKGVAEGSWNGPAKVLMTEGDNLIWISHMTRLYRCAPEHVRLLSADEHQGLTEDDVHKFQLPDRSGSGVFQFRQLTQNPPQERETNIPNPNIPNNLESEVIIHDNAPQNNHAPSVPPPSTIEQPDDEPNANPEIPSVPETPHAPNETTGSDDAAQIPVPADTDDELLASTQDHDHSGKLLTVISSDIM